MIAELSIFTAWIAIIGFWLTVMVFILRKPLSEAIADRTAGKQLRAGVPDVPARLTQLEAHVEALGKELELLRESNEFASKLLSDTANGATVAKSR